MAVIKRANVEAPTLPKETVDVAALDGEVVVRGLLLTERLAVEARIVALRSAPHVDGAAPDVNAILPVVLAICVLDADDLPLWTEQQWQVFGIKHQGQALALFNVAWRLSGFAQAQDAKTSPPA